MAFLLLGIVAAQSLASVQAATASTATIYRLNPDSSFQEGCFPPCLCPIMIAVPVKGTFLLTPTGFDGLFNTYAVTDVNWHVSINGTNMIVTGSGTYKIGGEVALEQELALDLEVGGAKTEHFDSGLVPTQAPFPNIDVTISVHGEICFDTVFHVDASPVPLNQTRPYHLLQGSTFQRGCVGACDCALGPLDPIVGTFALVPLEKTSASIEFAVVNARWVALDSSGRIPVRGFGVYQAGNQSNPQQELSLVLSVGQEDPLEFDSGVVSGGENFSLIDIKISVSGAICFDTWISLDAARGSGVPGEAQAPRVQSDLRLSQ